MAAGGSNWRTLKGKWEGTVAIGWAVIAARARKPLLLLMWWLAGCNQKFPVISASKTGASGKAVVGEEEMVEVEVAACLVSARGRAGK